MTRAGPIGEFPEKFSELIRLNASRNGYGSTFIAFHLFSLIFYFSARFIFRPFGGASRSGRQANGGARWAGLNPPPFFLLPPSFSSVYFLFYYFQALSVFSNPFPSHFQFSFEKFFKKNFLILSQDFLLI